MAVEMDFSSEREKKAIPVAGREAYSVEMLRIPHCLDRPLTDSGKVVSPTNWLCSITQKHYFSASGTHFC
jgi:hypothetical protein